jgi:lipoprotein NlpD
MKKIARLSMLSSMDRYLHYLSAIAVCTVLAACGSMRSSVMVEPAGGMSRAPNARTDGPTHVADSGGGYEVVRGDTLYSIAFRNGVDFRDLAQWNGIAVPYTIWPGQRLQLSPSALSGSRNHGSVPITRPTDAPVFEPVGTVAAHNGNRNVSVRSDADAPAKRAVAASRSTIVPVAGQASPAFIAAASSPAPVSSAPARAVSGVSWRWPAEGGLLKPFHGGDAIPGIEIAGKSGDPVRSAADGVVVYSGNGLVGYGELVIIKHNDSFLSAYGHNRKRLVKEGQRVSAGQQIAEMGSTGATRDELEFQIRKDGNPVDPLAYLPPR